MATIVAIGGGEIGRPGYPVETTHIDKRIVELSGKNHPHLLFLPTASDDSKGYIDTVQEHFGKRLGCIVQSLNLYDTPSYEAMEDAIRNADIIYVGGGNTLKMMTKWRKLEVDKLLQQAGERGAVLAGLSAGAICWFSGGLSDSRSFTSESKSWDYITVRGLGIYNLVLCPHFDVEPQRKEALKHSLQGSRHRAIAIDNCVALEITNDTYRIIGANRERGAYKAYWRGDKYHLESLTSGSAQPLSALLT